MSSHETLQGTGGEWPKLRSWARQHPEDLVLLVFSHCAVRHGLGHWSSMPCSDGLWTKEFQALALPFETNCETLSSMTRAEALQKARLKDGGYILGVDSACVRDNWDASVTSFDRVRPYVEQTMSRMKTEKGEKSLFQVQSFIQQKLRLI
eukprot:Skav233823  [mRNA]  locus=scaffold100:27558:35143:+ [translate_table: standard]